MVKGRVLDPDGKPVTGARLFASTVRKDPPSRPTDWAFVPRGVTDAGGRFQIELPRSAFRPQGRLTTLLAAADGYGVDWTDVSGDMAGAELTLRPVKDQPLHGRVLSTEGKPLAGVRVRVITLLATADGRIGRVLDLDGQPLAGVDVEIAYSDPTARELQEVLNRGEPIRTDKEGRFRVEGVVPGLGFAITLSDRRTALVSEPRLRLRQVKPGEKLDFGDLRTKPGNPPISPAP